MTASLSTHAARRCAQRSVRHRDIPLALEVGTDLDDGVFVRDADIRSQIDGYRTQMAELRRMIARLQRLRRLYVACPDATVVTVYRPSRRRERRILRNLDDSA